jgi:hypothetical protein
MAWSQRRLGFFHGPLGHVRMWVKSIVDTLSQEDGSNRNARYSRAAANEPSQIGWIGVKWSLQPGKVKKPG